MRILKNSETIKIMGALCAPIFLHEEGFGFSVSDNSVFMHGGYNYYSSYITDSNNKVVFTSTPNLYLIFFNSKNYSFCTVFSDGNTSEYYYK